MDRLFLLWALKPLARGTGLCRLRERTAASLFKIDTKKAQKRNSKGFRLSGTAVPKMANQPRGCPNLSAAWRSLTLRIAASEREKSVWHAAWSAAEKADQAERKHHVTTGVTERLLGNACTWSGQTLADHLEHVAGQLAAGQDAFQLSAHQLPGAKRRTCASGSAGRAGARRSAGWWHSG